MELVPIFSERTQEAVQVVTYLLHKCAEKDKVIAERDEQLAVTAELLADKDARIDALLREVRKFYAEKNAAADGAVAAQPE